MELPRAKQFVIGKVRRIVGGERKGLGVLMPALRAGSLRAWGLCAAS
jgi:hypothetical protein